LYTAIREVVDVRWFLFCLLAAVSPAATRGDVLLNEIYYDHAGSDEGFEFIELVNPDTAAVPLAGLTIEFHDGSSSGWTAIWRAAAADTIEPGGLFVVGGELVVPFPDAVDDLGLQNGPDAVRITRGGAEIDLVGYGPLDSSAFFEGAPAPDVDAGSSLARRPDGEDTNNNAADFDPSPPSPGRRNQTKRDAALRAASGTPRGDARPRPGTELLAFHIVNLGVNTIEPGAAALVLADSTAFGTTTTAVPAPAIALAAGDSVRADLAAELSAGDHWLIAAVTLGGDERPENDRVALRRRVGSSPVIVSEIMSDPRSGCPEYVELFNAGAIPYDLAGHRIRDAAHSGGLIASGPAEIPPGGFVVLCGDGEGLLACFGGLERALVVDIAGAWPSLNQTGSAGIADSVVIVDAESIPVERVGYPPQPTETRGRSLERVDLYAGSGPHTWVLSLDERGGSPGERSPLSRGAAVKGAGVTVSPNPFDPYRAEVLVVSFPERKETERVVGEAFDIAGRRVSEIGTARVFPSTLVWDGRDSTGRIVLPGVYVVACEFFSVTVGSRYVEKVVVGCGRKEKPGPLN
jgi:hypothetical protein